MTPSPRVAAPPRTPLPRFFVVSLSTASLVLLMIVFGNPARSARWDPPIEGGPPRVIAWNDLGMHCIDPDFAVFSILPPFNTVNAQVIVDGQLVTTGSDYTVTYEGVADPTGSTNTTSIGKTNFWDHVQDLFGVALPLDVGLTGSAMPGAGNVPQGMAFHGTQNWFQGEGIPITPLDDALQKNPYPLMKISVRDGANQLVASTVTTVPTSRELECSLCHTSGSNPFARPAAGWVNHPNPVKDDRFNILRLHDERQLANPAYTAALATAGYDPAGLFRTAAVSGVSILCDRCHASNALPGTGIAGIKPMTQAIHGFHGSVVDEQGMALDDDGTRAACYHCHPGRDTQCTRGAMGSAVGSDGEFSIHCQNCHGNLSAVGSPTRVGWLEEPNCQQCHTGTAVQNAGAIRFESVFDAAGNPHVPANQTFATTPDVPSTGFSLYRFSEGHGGLQCSACHGPPHAIYPTAFANDNVQSMNIQGHVGTITDCNVCHDDIEDNESLGGPHGMHPVDDEWLDDHGDLAENGLGACRACHGQNLRGTVLSRAQGNRTFNTQFGTKNFWRGFEVGCWACHDGPNDEDPNPNAAPVVPSPTLTTPNDVDLVIPLTGTDANGDALTFRIVSQPARGRGTVAIAGSVATFLPEPGFIGNATFGYAASDGDTDSNLGTVTVQVTTASCAGHIEAYGFGCPGTGDVTPILSVTGCPTPGGTVTTTIENGLGGAIALILVGQNRASIEIPVAGCRLRVFPILAVTPPLPLSGTGPGAGAFTVTATFPPEWLPGSFTLQAFVADPGAAVGWSMSNGIEIDVQ